jgi:C-terminal processing protease CtpA/Prc
VLGVSSKDGKTAVEGVEPGDKLLQIGDLATTGATMGVVVDALRGKPGEIRILILERAGDKFGIEARVMRFLS